MVFSVAGSFGRWCLIFTWGLGLAILLWNFLGDFGFFFSRMGRSCDTGHGELSFLLGGCVKEKWVLNSGFSLFVWFVHCLLAARYALLSSVRVSGSLWFFAWGFGSVGLLLCEVGLMGFCFFGCGLVPKGRGGREGRERPSDGGG